MLDVLHVLGVRGRLVLLLRRGLVLPAGRRLGLLVHARARRGWLRMPRWLAHGLRRWLLHDVLTLAFSAENTRRCGLLGLFGCGDQSRCGLTQSRGNWNPQNRQ